MNQSRRRKALEGVKVVDFTWMVAGPMMTRSLADNGATVVLIEGGLSKVPVLRTASPFMGKKPGINRSGYFAIYAGGKYSITLDLSHPRGLDVAMRLVVWADVVAESFRPGVVKKLGLDYDRLKTVNPSVIMVSTTNQGQTGPQARQPGVGTQLVSLAGFTEITGWPDRVPAQPYGAYTDVIAPRFGVVAILAALDYRRRTGKGQYIDLSQYEAGIQFLAPAVLDYSANGRVLKRAGNECPYACPHNVYPCVGEDRWCAIAVFSNQEWQELCRLMERPELGQDPKFTTLGGRKQNEEYLDQIIGSWTRNHRAEELMDKLQSAGIAAGMASNCQDLHEDRQLKHRHHFWVLDHSEMGPHSYDGPPYLLSKTPASVKRAAPCLGEHNEFVCREFLEMSDEEFLDLIGAGVFD